MSTLQYYVYYKFDSARTEELRAVVSALFQEIASATGVRGKWECRRDDPATFMEVYADVPAACDFDAALEAALGKVGFARLVPQRMTEVFQCA